MRGIATITRPKLDVICGIHVGIVVLVASSKNSKICAASAHYLWHIVMFLSKDVVVII